MGWSWIALATFVVRHDCPLCTHLGGEMVGKLCSAEQSSKETDEITGGEFHGSVPQPGKDDTAVELFFDRSQAYELIKV